MQKILDTLSSTELRDLGDGASEDAIALAEKELNVVFPTDYVAFLRAFGWEGVAHWEIFGVGSNVPTFVVLVTITGFERHELQPNLPHCLVPIMNDGGGNLFCLDTTEFEGGKCRVVFWNHDSGADQLPIYVSDSFETFLSNLLFRSSS